VNGASFIVVTAMHTHADYTIRAMAHEARTLTSAETLISSRKVASNRA